jgi:hypothetical protein
VGRFAAASRKAKFTDCVALDMILQFLQRVVGEPSVLDLHLHAVRETMEDVLYVVQVKADGRQTDL